MEDLTRDPWGEGGFWRGRGRSAVPGRIRAMSSYQAFQASVSDAWELSAEEELASRVADASISRAVSRSAALSVINSHRSTQQQARADNTYSTPLATDNNNAEQSSKCEAGGGGSGSGGAGGGGGGGAEGAGRRAAAGRHYPGRPRAVKPAAAALGGARDESCESKLERFQQLQHAPVLDLAELKQLSWSGIPVKARAVTWRLLSGYLPANMERRTETLERKRADYWHFVKQYYAAERDDDTYHQIHIDVPRMSPLVALFQQLTVQLMFERILYIWAIRHPASGYVQGINDLVTPFFMVFLQEATGGATPLDDFPVDRLSEEQRARVEADSFWCLSKFLDSIQDNYIFAQLGIQHKVNQLKELIRRVDRPLHEHLQRHGVDYLQFSFRWMNNLLTRELPLPCTIRLWDTYLAESDGFATFQLYVCAAFLLHWREPLLRERDFQGLMILLQNVPTQNWQDSHIGVLVAEAYRLKFAFADAPSHLHESAAPPAPPAQPPPADR